MKKRFTDEQIIGVLRAAEGRDKTHAPVTRMPCTSREGGPSTGGAICLDHAGGPGLNLVDGI